ncbi:PspA-associated protein PspAB [Vallicoccus soli]|uniref:Uncharacterized protein n=1 Tax=Vallicoccus soli TaxID=2339232 RepID=A0A3A3ZLB2_9ACTN|nr:hypothetical protein [Vallicoccus soli]RJK96912.1 hypothetical protein D5H78_06595 [Vallicoccus soli]
MGFLDKLLGRTTPVKPDLDQLFGVPSAALTLEASAGFRPTGLGSVAFRAAEGGAFASTEREVQALLDADDGPPVERSQDPYGYTWLLVRHDPGDVAGLVTDLHAVNTTLEGQGFGPQLLCSIVGFADDRGRRLALVYLYKRGAFYPFAPSGPERRDNALELQVRGLLTDDLRVEQDLSRWFPVWGAPGL